MSGSSISLTYTPNRNLKILLVTVIILLLSISQISAQNYKGLVTKQASDNHMPEYVPGEVLVRFKPSASKKAIQSNHIQMDSTLLERIPGRIERVRIKKGITVDEVIKKYMQTPEVEHAQPNFIYHLDYTPNDTSFDKLWGLHNTGQTVNGVVGKDDADIDAFEAWDITTGSNTVVVAVIDTGIVYNHPDLVNNIWINTGETSCTDGVDNDGNGKD